MKLKHLLIINIFLAIIIFLNYFSFNKKKDNVFERNFINSPVTTVKKDFILLNTATSRMINSSHSICITENIKDSTHLTIYRFDSSLPILKKKQLLSQNFNLFFDNNFLYSINKGLLFINGSPINQLEKMKILNLTIFNGEILVLGELNNNNKFILGFYRISPYNFEIKNLITLEEESSSHYPEYFLSYMGNFSPTDEKKVLYACNKSSLVWIFDIGKVKEFNTLDKTPIPKILSTGENFYFERGATLNTNMASFIKGSYIFIFSNRSEYKNMLILDKYDFNGNYINSYKVSNFNKESKDILSISKQKNKIAIAYNNYISLLSITNL